ATHRGTGFVFRDYNPVALSIALGRALEVYRQPERWLEIQVQGMQRDSSWTASASRYVDLYHEAIELKRLRSPS
ncbi:MAG: glgA, partial [Chloroflexi bacterium]|nr:glgA [Chloroflexota bacterium]